MLTIRHVAFAAILTTAASQPVLAETCNFSIGGAKVLDDAECTVSKSRGVIRADAGSGATVLIRRSMLSSSIADDRHPVRRGFKRNRLYSYGRIIESLIDDKLCYSNPSAVFCVEH